jgi:periplasmic protein TonB
MTSQCPSALASLDEPVALLYESLGKLKAAKSVDIANFTQQLKMAAKSARIVRELVWVELPGAAWQDRAQLDALNEKIQEILTARTLEQLRSRLLALATELERGSIVHRRAHRLSELDHLRDKAVNELRSQASLEGAPPTLPGPEADQWIEWACGLKEPQDAESLQTLRDGFAHLDDLVANLERSMWIAASSPALATLPKTERPAAIRQPEQSRVETNGSVRAVLSSAPDFAIRVGLDAKHEGVAGPILTEDPPLSRPQDMATAPGQYIVPALSEALATPLASLDEPLALLYESLAKLKAAQTVDVGGVVEQLKMAAESARNVRELVLSELPEASWQNREELDALLEKIQKILDARALEQLRSRMLALATELERGTIVHRRAHRLGELNQLRDHAVNELRSQAGLDGALRTLPGPQADQWIEWACSLKEPQDAESLQTLRDGFAHLDDFVANLEPNMWIGTATPTLESQPETDKCAHTTLSEQSPVETKRLEEPVVSPMPMEVESEAAKSGGWRDEPRLPGLLHELSVPSLESNTLTPNDATPPRTDEEIQRILQQEQALLASMMGIVTDPARHFNRPAEPHSTAEIREKTSVAPAKNVEESAHHVNRPLERPFTAEAFREPSAPPANDSDIRTGAEEPWSGKWRMLLVIIAMLALAALVAVQWRSRRNQGGNGAVKASERTIPNLARSSPDDQSYRQSLVSTKSETHTSSPTTPTEKAPKLQEQSVAPKPLPKPSPTKPANELHDAVLRPPSAISRNIAMGKTEGTPPNATAEMPGSIPGALPNGVANNVANIARDIPVAAPKIAAQKVRVSSGVAQGLLIHQVTPKYPPLARQARIQGTVVLQAVIGKDGTVQNLHVLSGHPMLTQSAMDAVKQWRYKPYFVNGEPVEADTQINVNFNLSGG